MSELYGTTCPYCIVRIDSAQQRTRCVQGSAINPRWVAPQSLSTSAASSAATVTSAQTSADQAQQLSALAETSSEQDSRSASATGSVSSSASNSSSSGSVSYKVGSDTDAEQEVMVFHVSLRQWAKSSLVIQVSLQIYMLSLLTGVVYGDLRRVRLFVVTVVISV